MEEQENTQVEELTPEEQAAAKKQRSLNRVFWLLVGIAALLFAMLIYEIVVLVK